MSLATRVCMFQCTVYRVILASGKIWRNFSEMGMENIGAFEIGGFPNYAPKL